MANHKQARQKQQWDLPAGSHVWVYLRHSPGDKQTIESQAYGMQEWCGFEQWIIDRIFVDEAEEGSKEQRPQFQEMMSLARQGARSVDGIVVWSFSRFARNQLDSQYYKADLRKRGYVVVSKIDDVPNNEIGPIIESVIDWKNQRFLEDMSADVSRGLLYLVEKGYWPTGKPPIGYKVQKVEIGNYHSGDMRLANCLIKDEAVADRVALAWKMKLYDNASYLDIYEATHLYGLPTHYLYMFDNLLYTGIFEYNNRRYPGNWESGSRFCEPYITMEEYQRVQANRQKRTISVIAPRTLSSRYLLSGMLRCGICADKGKTVSLVGGSGGQLKPNYLFYRCGSKIKERGSECNLSRHPCWRIDDAVLALLKQTVLTPDFIIAEIDKARAMMFQSQGDFQTKIKDALRASKDLEKRVESIVTLISHKGMTPILEKQYDAVNKAWTEASTNLSVLKLQAAQSMSNDITKTDVLQSLDEVVKVLECASVEKRRDLISRFIDHVTVYPDRIEITLTFRLDSLTIPYHQSEDSVLMSPSEGAYVTLLPGLLGCRFRGDEFELPIRGLRGIDAEGVLPRWLGPVAWLLPLHLSDCVHNRHCSPSPSQWRGGWGVRPTHPTTMLRSDEYGDILGL